MKIRLKDSLFTNNRTYGKGFYNVPEEMPEETARKLVKCGHAELISDDAPPKVTKAERKVKTDIEHR